MDEKTREADLLRLQDLDEHSALHNAEQACENVTHSLAQLAVLQAPLDMDYTGILEAMQLLITRVHDGLAAAHKKYENLH